MGPGRGPTNGDEGFSVSADFKCFRKRGVGPEGGPLMMVKDPLFLLILNVQRSGCGARYRGFGNDDEEFFVSVMTMKNSFFVSVLF